MRRSLILLFAAALLAGCAGLEDPTHDWGPERFYQEAKDKMANSDWEGAIKLFEQLESRYPYGPYAEQAQIEVAYAYYKYDEPALAIAAADRFLRQHPTHPHADYALYLKGLVNFSGEHTFINMLLGAKKDPMAHDPKALREAYHTFREVVERFPHSRYAADARARMNYLYDAGARYEVHIARFYFERGAYVASLNRCKHALENYPRTQAVEDALGLQAMSYKMLGLTPLFDDTLRVLKLNFPQSNYFAEIEALKAPAVSEKG